MTTDSTIVSRFRPPARATHAPLVRFLGGRLHWLLMWPAICAVLLVAMVTVMSSMLAEQKKALDGDALKDASVMAQQYGDQLERSIGQIDALTSNIRQRWESARTQRDLSSRVGARLYPLSGQFYVLLVDRDGYFIQDDGQRGMRVADRAYFSAHRDSPSDAMLISEPMSGRISKRQRIVFSRRVNDARGGFAGIVLVSVDPAYFASTLHADDMGKRDFLILLDREGHFMTRKTHPSAPALMSTARILTSPGLSGAVGARPIDGDYFDDGVQRFVAWRRLERYQLTVVAALSEEQEFMPYADSLAHFKRIGAVAALILGAFALAGMSVTAWLLLRKQQGEEVKQTYRLAVDAARDGFYMVQAQYDNAGDVIDFIVADCNERGAAYYGLTRHQLIGRHFRQFVPDAAYVAEVIRVFSLAMESGYYEDELQVPGSSPMRATWLHRKLMRSHDGLAVTLRDISDTKAHDAAIVRMVNEDRLTGLPNRNWLNAFLPQAISEALQNDTGLGLMFLDLDDFKDLNDTLGHAVGDELLQVVGSRLRAVVRPQDHVTRQDGDEFSIVITGVQTPSCVADVASRIGLALAQPILLQDGSRHGVRASIGISLLPEHGTSADALFQHADLALVEAKAAGKNQFCFYSDTLSQRLVQRIDREQALRAAIANDEFVLFYQPRVDTFTGELRSMEALVRWIHPVRGIVPPMEFIDLAERTGLIVPLGEMVIDKACAQIAAWQAQGLPLVPVSVNVSPRQFTDGEVAAYLAGKLHQHGIAPALIEMEITESCMMGDTDEIAASLAVIKQQGIKLLVDDFGTGYASLSQLQRLRLDGLKIDRSFTTALEESAEGQVFYQAILSMAQALGMSVVAEGVETAAQLKLLQSMSCAEIQGYYISRPVPAAEMAQMMTRRFLFPKLLAAVPLVASLIDAAIIEVEASSALGGAGHAAQHQLALG